ncbi:hypothetical protein ElyMa_005730500 [Elysia marginata]|uniref:Uncharacterized protein n=1 Tax=Elysia marginata TaxID=1093978 RepID=A0AAV4FL90_9GAST|nr:hypothetical protein ElyMa_005730500 [Elysia marginata]
MSKCLLSSKKASNTTRKEGSSKADVEEPSSVFEELTHTPHKMVAAIDLVMRELAEARAGSGIGVRASGRRQDRPVGEALGARLDPGLGALGTGEHQARPNRV